MATKKLRRTVYVADENGTMQMFSPGDKVPGWAQKAITNPLAWEKADKESEESEDTEPEAEETEQVEAPRGNASRSEWADYAASQGVRVNNTMTRDDIVAAVEATKRG